MKVGDAVKLKGSADGPAMTVVKAGQLDVLCGWFQVNGNYREHKWPVDAIEPAPKEKK